MMAALVQSLPSPSTSTMTMLSTRSPSAEAFQNGSQGQHHPRGTKGPKNVFNTSVGGMGAGNYRGQTATPPISPFSTFQSSPVIQSSANPLRQHPTAMQHPRYETRTASAPSLPVTQPQSAGTSTRPRPPPANSASAPLNPSSQSLLPQTQPSEDSSTSNLTSKHAVPQSLASLDLNLPQMQVASYANVAKSSPDRYRRNHRRAETAGGLTSNPPVTAYSMPPGSGSAPVANSYNQPGQTSSTPALSNNTSYRGAASANPTNLSESGPKTHIRHASKDDMNVQPRQSSTETAKRYRRRSISSLEVKDYTFSPSETSSQSVQPKTYAAMLAGPAPSSREEVRGPAMYERSPSAHGRKESYDSGTSGSSGVKASSAKRVSELASSAQQATHIAKNEVKVVSVPARGSSEASKRLTNPSPLSKPMAAHSELPASKGKGAVSEQPKAPPSPIPAPTSRVGLPESPAAQQLAALNKKEGKKDKPSRLRRAFSFGSAAELRKASAENNANASANANTTVNASATRERNKLQKPQYADEEEAQQAAIAQQQEASGLGEGIYSGQGHFFTGSTDNLSISSTASSASVMIRKMGKGVKKGSRSLAGLFRPKSVVGVPAADSAVPEPSVAQVSMVTVEAEREKVNVNADPHDQPGGGTGFPKLERNSLDSTSIVQESTQSFTNRDSPRRSIVGGERERAEVLAAVKKGILKRTGTDSGNSSPQARPVDPRPPVLPQIPRFNDTPNSSGPSTPVDETTPRGHNKTDSVHIDGEEYFLNIQSYANRSSTSMPGTPGRTNRNISFSPRIQFHDTWPSGEYDRRGEIATCNRLTPMLAQQIKEELNTFKMEMEVHIESKVNTHFF